MFLRFFCLVFLTTSVFANSNSFDDFLDQVRKSAIEQGVSKSTIDQAFSGLPHLIHRLSLKIAPKLSSVRTFGAISTKESVKRVSIMEMIH